MSTINTDFYLNRLCDCTDKYKYETYDDNFFLRCMRCNKFTYDVLSCGHMRLKTNNHLPPLKLCKTCVISNTLEPTASKEVQDFFNQLLNDIHYSEHKEIQTREYKNQIIKLMYGPQYIGISPMFCHGCYNIINDTCFTKIRKQLCYQCTIDELLC